MEDDRDDESFGDVRETLETLTALFCEQEEFESTRKAKAFLDEAKTEDDSEILGQMVQCASEIITSKVNDDGVAYFENSELSVLLTALAEYTRQPIDLRGFAAKDSGNTILVLTHAAEISDNTEIIGTPEEKQQLVELHGTIKTLRAQKAEKTRQRIKCKDGAEKYELQEEIPGVTKEMEKKEARIKCIRIKICNCKVVNKMKDLYATITGDPQTLSAFAVGNGAYQVYQAGYNASNMLVLEVEDAGIPDLRRCLYQMPVVGKHRDAMLFAETHLPSLIHSFELFTNKTHMEGKGEIEGIVLAPKEKVPEIVSAAFREAKADAVTRTLSPMQAEEVEWTREAHRIAQGWARKYPKAKNLYIFKKNGIKKGRGKAAKHIDWTAELLDIAKDGLERRFATLIKAFKRHLGPLTTEVSTLVSSTGREISSKRKFDIIAMEPFLRSFRMEKENVRSILDRAVRALTQEVGNIMDKTIFISEDDYFTSAMAPIYAECRKAKNPSAPTKHMQLLERQVSKLNGILVSVRDQIESALEAVFREQEQEIVKSLQGIFAGIHNRFLMICAHTKDKTEEERAMEEVLIEKLKGNLVKVKVKVMEGKGGEIANKLAECEAWELNNH